MWPDRRILDLFGIEHPILLAPMAGPVHADMAIAVSNAGGLGSLPCALLDSHGAREELEEIRRGTNGPVNLNFFCHAPAPFDEAREKDWRARLAPYFAEYGVQPPAPSEGPGRAPFDEAFCALVESFRPEVVSFHFGLPGEALLARVKAAGAKVISSATTAAEAVWLENRGCDAIIAQGSEAGGHRGIFLGVDISSQPGTMALVPQVVDVVKVPVIAAGGIADARGIVAALALGASAVQIGTAFLFCPEARLSAPHRAALARAADDQTVLTRVFTGRPARAIVNRLVREVGAMSDLPPAFPMAVAALAPLRSHAEAAGSGDFTPLWSGQAAALGRPMPAAELTERLASEALELLARLSGR